MKIDLNEVVVYVGGVVDVDATLAVIRKEVEKFADGKVQNDSEIEQNVYAVFNQNGIANRIDMTTLVHVVLTRMNVETHEMKLMSEKITDYIHRNRGVRFDIKRGRGGGIALIKQ